MSPREPDWRTINAKLDLMGRRLRTLESLGIALAARLAVEDYGEYVRQVARWAQKRSGGR